MRRRPQPNHRRGLLRAGIAVVVLLAILLAALLIVASLTAPTANAPAPTPPAVPKTPGKTSGTVTPQGTPHPTTRPTKGHGGISKDVSLGQVPLSKAVPSAQLRAVSGPWIAYFSRDGDAYHGSMLYLRAGTSAPLAVGPADRFVRPVWSANHRAVLYVRVAATSRYPGARWTLLQYDVLAHKTAQIVQADGMGLEPLGWRHGQVLYALSHSSATDTSLYAANAGRTRFLSILTTQPASAPTMSPDGRWIAYLAPADCSYCTLSIFDLNGLTTWYGPSGIPNKYDLAWNRSGTVLVVSVGSRLAAIAMSSHQVHMYRTPARLPAVWTAPLEASIVSNGLRLVDGAGQSFLAPADITRS